MIHQDIMNHQITTLILVNEKLWRISIWVIFLNLSYGLLWRISKTTTSFPSLTTSFFPLITVSILIIISPFFPNNYLHPYK